MTRYLPTDYFKGFTQKFNTTHRLDDQLTLIYLYQPKSSPQALIRGNNSEARKYFTEATRLSIDPQLVFTTPTPSHRSDPFRKGWLDINSFLYNISNMTKGEQHRYATSAIIHTKNIWTRTLFLNSLSDIRKLISLFNKLNLSHSLVITRGMHDLKFSKERDDKYDQLPEAQMFNAMRYFTGSGATNDVNTITQNITNATARIDNITIMYNDIVTRIYNFLNQTLAYGNLALIFAKIVSFSYLITTLELCTSQLLSLITLILPTCVGAALEKLSAGLIRAVETVRRYYANPSAQVETYDSSILGAFFSLIKTLFVSFVNPMDKPTFEKMNIDGRKISVVSDFLRSCTNIWSFILKIIEVIFEYMKDAISYSFGYLPAFFKKVDDNNCDRLTAFINFYNSLFIGTPCELDKCKTSTESAKIIVSALNEARSLENDLYHESVNSIVPISRWRVLPLLRLAVTHLQKVVVEIPPHVRDGFEGFRKKPFWLYMHGETNIGKSSILQPVIANCLAACLNLVDNFDDPHNYSYYRVCGAKYFTSYHKQPIIQYNDLFQNTGDEEAMNEAIMELTNIVDEAPFELNMADIESKGKYYCTSSIVISNSQNDIIGQPFITNKCWSHGAHIYRRRNLVIRPVLNPAYASPQGINPSLYPANFTPSKYVDFVPDDIYTIHFTDVNTGTTMSVKLLDDALDYIMECAKKHLEHQDSLHNKLNDTLKSSFKNIRNMSHVKTAHTTQQVRSHNLVPQQPQVKMNPSIIPSLISNVTNNPTFAVAQMFNTHNFNQALSNAYQSNVPAHIEQRVEFLTPGANDTTKKHLSSLFNVACTFLPPETQKQAMKEIVTFTTKNYSENIDFSDTSTLNRTKNWVFSRVKYWLSSSTNNCSKYFYSISPRLYNRKTKSSDIDDNAFEYKDATCDCFEHWDSALRIHPLLINDIPMASTIRTILTQRHRDMCGVVSCDSEHIITNILIEILHSHMNQNYATYNFQRYMTGLANLTCKTFHKVKNSIVEQMLINPLHVSIGVILGLIPILGCLTYYIYPKQQQSTKNPGETDVSEDYIIAQTDEGNRVAKKVRIRRKKPTVVDNGAVGQYDSTNRTVENVVRENIVTFHVVSVQGDQVFGENMYIHGLCVEGSTFMLPRHFWRFALQMVAKHQCCLQVQWISGSKTNIPFKNILVYTPEHEHSRDLIFIRIPRLCSKRSIKHFFVKESDEVLVHESYLFGRRSLSTFNDISTISVDGVTLVGLNYIVNDAETNSCGTIPGEIISTPIIYKYYNSKTIGGDCGAILFFVNSKLGCRVLAGMHVAGQPTLNTGYSVPIYQEDIDEAIISFNETSTDITSNIPVFAQMDRLNKTNMGCDLSNIGANVIGRTGKYKGKIVNLPISRKSKISPSLCQDRLIEELGPNTQAPVRLRPFMLDNEKVSPLLKAYQKLNRMCPNMIPNDIYDDIVQHMYQSIQKWHSFYSTDNIPRSVLNNDETINGVPGLKQLDLSTSPGFPYILDDNTAGKRPWFEIDRTGPDGFIYYKMNEALLKEVEDRENLAKKGIKKETYFVDALKDETRPLDKVKIGKTRLFQVAPMDLNILIRKYFGHYLAHLSTTFMEGECAVGVNALSNEWHYMFQPFQKKYDFDSDAKDFDASTSHQLGYSFADGANMWYDDGPENARVRITLMCTVFESLHIVGDAVIENLQGNKSGIAATTHVNNNSNMFSSRFAYLFTKSSLQDYLQELLTKYYGDDVRGNTNLEWFNNDYLHYTLSFLGYDITPCDKESGDAVTFIKRTSKFHPDVQYTVGVLPIPIIHEIARWSESDPSNMRDQMNRFNSALLEVSLYGKEQHKQLYSVFEKCCFDLASDRYEICATQLFTYDTALRIMFPDRLIPKIPLNMLDGYLISRSLTNSENSASSVEVREQTQVTLVTV